MDGRVGVGGTDDLRGAEGEQDTPTLAHDRAIRGAVVKAGRLELGLAIRFGFGSVLFLVSFPFVLKSLFVFVCLFKRTIFSWERTCAASSVVPQTMDRQPAHAHAREKND